MRTLTLDEKITFKGLFAKKGLSLPRLNTRDAAMFWHSCFGGSILDWVKKSNRSWSPSKPKAFDEEGFPVDLEAEAECPD